MAWLWDLDKASRSEWDRDYMVNLVESRIKSRWTHSQKCSQLTTRSNVFIFVSNLRLKQTHPQTDGQTDRHYKVHYLPASLNYVVDNDLFNLCYTSKSGLCCGELWVRHMFCGRDLWWTILLHIFHWSCWDTLWIPNDHICPSQSTCVQMPVVSSSYLRVYMGCALAFVWQVRSLYVP